MSKLPRTVPSLAILALVALPPLAASAEDFRWQGKVAAGKTVEIKGINGGIEARAASGSEVLVTATKRGRDRELDEVKIEMIEHEGGVTVCAIYPSRKASRPNQCLAGEGHSSNSDNQVQVEFEVQVPRGVHFVGRTVNGGVEAVDLPADAFAYTVNGGVKVTAGGEVRAETVNGSIRASMGRADGREPLSFKTVNGGITVELPASVEADVHAETVNGGIETDFPLTVKGKWVGRRIDGQIGAGGRRLELATVNGSIALRKSSS
ncbi:MAG TPA: DUF4097 family beta strand repeat-containing protein [Vicinamibacteria bacterium]